MTTWRQAKARLHADNPKLKEEYEKLGPRFAAISELIDARERMKISQSELARRMNVNPNVVNRLESAQHSPLLDTLIEYADALGIDFKLRLTKRTSGAREVRAGRRATASRGIAMKARPTANAHPVSPGATPPARR